MAGCGAWSRCRWAAGPALSKSRMQFTNTSDVTPQTDINQHNTGGELHAKLRNDEQHTSTSCGARWEAAAWPAGPGRGAGGRWLGLAGLRDRPLRAARLACGDLAGGPPPTGTYSGQAQQHRPRGGRKSIGAAAGPGRRAAAHRHIQRPGPTKQATRRPEICQGNKQRQTSDEAATTRSRPAPQGPGGSRIRPLGGSQRLFQRIWVPSEPRRWQASTTRAAMPASADLPHVRGSYCFFTPTSPSILRTPS